MLTIFEINPEGYENEIFKGETLEQLIQEVTNYFEEWQSEEVFEKTINSAKDAYEEECNEYVYNCCGSICALNDELLRAEVEPYAKDTNMLGFSFNYDDSLEIVEFYYGEDNIKELELNVDRDTFDSWHGEESEYLHGNEEVEYLEENMGDKYELMYHESYLAFDGFGGFLVKYKIIARVK